MSAATVDVVVVGGGLAGCSAAISLAQRGWRVVLLEAKTYPHDKVCGEFLSPECAVLLDALGMTRRLHDLKPVCIDSVRITLPNGMTWNRALPGEAMGVSRYALDHALAEQARELGVDVREGTTVTDIQGNLNSGFTLATRRTADDSALRAKAVVGAHGKRSTLDRALDRAFLRTPQPFVGLKAHFEGAPIPRRVDLHTFPGGYCGMSEVEGGRVNVCLLARQDVFQRARDIPGFIGWMRAQNPALDAWFARAQQVSDRWLSIAQIPFVSKPPVERDILMAGDSAGLIAPLAGDGMGMALAAGQLAADHLDALLAGERSATDVRQGYAREWQAQFGGRLRLGRVLQAVMLRPRLLAVGLRAVNTVPALGDYFVNGTRDMSLYSG